VLVQTAGPDADPRVWQNSIALGISTNTTSS
jgi:hypothetical protein